ncbi:MAG TPA: bifunctional precorrin-2 dehydrogenase/sirohydrochlorin ferrochelatase [Verrucomicrobiae bacterium]|nr:bifunctional precorrin-2 dehydrogenase/sirohydrochlorin ferrochelatase [Verrucomicrobiae bacterium]
MHYPLFLNLAGQPVVVVGAGNVATRKVRTLLSAQAQVTVISPDATATIRQLARTKRLRWIHGEYRRGDLASACLAIAATDDPAVNRAICTEARRRKILVNCIAPPSAGNFIVPSQVRRGGISLAISTGGASPAFAKRLRLDLECFLGDRYPELLRTMRAARLRGRSLAPKTAGAGSSKAMTRRAKKRAS